MVDILFVSPPTPSPEEHAGYNLNAPPLGIGYLAAILRENGFEVDAIDLAFSDKPVADLRQKLRESDPRVVGFYTTTVTYYGTERLLAAVRKDHPEAITWVGGPHVSYEYETALASSGFDVVFLFEAEHSVLEAAKVQLRGKGRLDDVAGIAFRRDGRTIKTTPRAREKSLDIFPYPARDLFPIKKYTRPGSIMSSRGCPVKCIFCIASTFEDAYRYRSPENVVGEMKLMYEQWGINDFYFVDNVFTTYRARAREICRLIREADLPIGWYCVSRVDYAEPELMQDLASAGCYRIELGVESGDPSVIGGMKKHISLAHVYRAADVILNLGMQPMFTFQVGHPHDTLDSIEATLRLAEEIREMGAGAYLSVTTPYPGAPMMIEREKYGIVLETTNWEDFRWSNPTYRTATLSRNDIRKAIYRGAVGMARTLAEGKFQDPPSAPWLRFGPNGNGMRLPPPPTSRSDDDTALFSVPDRKRTLPVLQVAR
ncbi:radical SAM protein [Rhodospirillum rubrum]|uniref:B12-binding domain-containing radical SAM protein n=1 Tax=Rhodospirillum rubrum TaxID=1085 RepID=UPI001903956D|nr:radical SAM protein [Rhodospirillum rubrum]MBK1663614.1 radical SAM protein [Rhodospirillum rubrum]MBK1675953.1 radical SAM protein [Rhodospirillum rubrum]